MARAWRRWLALILVGGTAALLMGVATAPASWADLALRRASLDRVRLADAAGTVWKGAGRLVLLDGTPGAEVASGFALPGPLQWELRPLALLAGVVDATLVMPGMAKPIRLNGSLGEWRVEAGAVDLPSAELSRLGSPWNTIQPSAQLALRWDALTIRETGFEGRIAIDLANVSSAMTPVRPLGSYRVDVLANGRDVDLKLATLSGALNLQGSGRWDRRAGLRFNAEARGDGPDRARLQSLLGLIGRREGDRTMIKIGG